jgi:hypothetical protein
MRPLPFLAGLLAFVLPGAASAATITVNFTGTIIAVPTELSAGFTPFDAVSGSFQFDSTTLDTVANPNVGFYPGPTNFSFTFGSYTATSPGGEPSHFIRVDDNLVLSITIDLYGVETRNVTGASFGLFQPSRLTFILGDSTATAFESDALPTSLDLSAFDSHSAAIVFANNGDLIQVVADITSIAEPSTFALLGLTTVVLRLGRPRRG